jgi:hypothetical protein
MYRRYLFKTCQGKRSQALNFDETLADLYSRFLVEGTLELFAI